MIKFIVSKLITFFLPAFTGKGGQMVRKIVSVFLGIFSVYSFLGGVFLKISNVQGQRMPDGNPLDPEWLIWVFILIIPILTGFSAAILWPKDPLEKTREFLRNGSCCVF